MYNSFYKNLFSLIIRTIVFSLILTRSYIRRLRNYGKCINVRLLQLNNACITRYRSHYFFFFFSFIFLLRNIQKTFLLKIRPVYFLGTEKFLRCYVNMTFLGTIWIKCNIKFVRTDFSFACMQNSVAKRKKKKKNKENEKAKQKKQKDRERYYSIVSIYLTIDKINTLINDYGIMDAFKCRRFSSRLMH